jgi:RNA polymerase sigma-70 factor (ECF subfamily)
MADDTCWTLIQAVRDGNHSARASFVERYHPAVTVYLRARWKSSALQSECEDAAQEVFLRCFGESGPLDRVARGSDQSFRGFLYGICRNVAREMEARHAKRARGGETTLEGQEGNEERLSALFDRAFARQVMKEARARFRSRSEQAGEKARRRYELLGLRFEEGIPIREIAARWGEDAAVVHKEYARARREYREALLEVVAEQDPGRSQSELEEAAQHLLEIIR